MSCVMVNVYVLISLSSHYLPPDRTSNVRYGNACKCCRRGGGRLEW
jgi:hypothetical protein